MPLGAVRPNILRFASGRAGSSCALALLLVLFGSRSLQNAIAEGETRTITMHHVHTGEDITITYKREGRYDEAALEKLNWFLRDWRRSEQTRMDPHLIDLVWEVARESGSKQPIEVICGFRSPATNAMLRRRSRGVARSSQHMLGHAMDFYVPGVPLEQLRVIGLRLQRGGVGFYPTSGSPFVHMDTGGVRMWPRMTREQLLHVFPDGRTAYLPSDGRPLPGYELALAAIKKRGSAIAPADVEVASAAPGSFNPLAKLFGLGQREPDEDADIETASIAAPTRAAAPAAPVPPAATHVATANAPPPPPTHASAPANNPLLAALEREAARKRETSRLAAPAKPAPTKPSAEQPATYQLASFEHASAAPAAAAAGRAETMTPNQIILARGYWAGLPDDAAPVRPNKNPAGGASRLDHNEIAAARAVTAPLATGAIATGALAPGASPWPAAPRDRVPPDLALAYAEQPEQSPPPAAVLARARAAALPATFAAPAPPPIPPAATTIAVKRGVNQKVSTIVAAAPRPAAAARGERFENPWLRAVMLSPSVRRYLTTLMLGEQDYRALAALVDKPASAVMMTFGAEPNPGLAHDRFAGSAVVFVSTVTFAARTAALR